MCFVWSFNVYLKGSFGIVYELKNRESNQKFAIKIINKEKVSIANFWEFCFSFCGLVFNMAHVSVLQLSNSNYYGLVVRPWPWLIFYSIIMYFFSFFSIALAIPWPTENSFIGHFGFPTSPWPESFKTVKKCFGFSI